MDPIPRPLPRSRLVTMHTLLLPLSPLLALISPPRPQAVLNALPKFDLEKQPPKHTGAEGVSKRAAPPKAPEEAQVVDWTSNAQVRRL